MTRKLSTVKSKSAKPTKTRTRRNRKPVNAAQLANALLNPAPPPPPTEKKVMPITHVGMLIDRSVSMQSHTEGVKRTFKDLIAPIHETAVNQDVRLSVWSFGSMCYSPVLFEARCQDLDSKYIDSYEATDHSTALHDSFLTVINSLSRLPDANDLNSSFLIVVITDGDNNVGNRLKEVKNLVMEKQGTDRWTFVVSTPQRFVNLVNRQLGIPMGNIKGWNEGDSRGMDAVASAHVSGIRNYMGVRASGATSTNNYFVEANIGRQGIRTVTKDLVPEQLTRFKRLKVTKASDVKTLTESKGLKFELGRIFYQLQKPEVIQHYKEIILQRRNDAGKMYGGTQVRDKLGIPHGTNGKVVPGNLGEWIVWVQSTSPNRKLLAGMEVLYDTNTAPSSNGRATWVAPPAPAI